MYVKYKYLNYVIEKNGNGDCTILCRKFDCRYLEYDGSTRDFSGYITIKMKVCNFPMQNEYKSCIRIK